MYVITTAQRMQSTSATCAYTQGRNNVALRLLLLLTEQCTSRNCSTCALMQCCMARIQAYSDVLVQVVVYVPVPVSSLFGTPYILLVAVQVHEMTTLQTLLLCTHNPII
eukprot:16107-Heterococcus_DN1.PRE.3